MEKRETLGFITGLRGYAALFVFLIHAGTFLGGINGYMNKVVNFGKYGVTIFFIISAFTLCMSIDRDKLFDYRLYLRKRILRVMPMYYVVMVICFLLGGFLPLALYYKMQFNIPLMDFKNLFYHLIFYGFINQRYQNSLLGVEWTIPLEFFYYLIIPFIFFVTKKSKVFLLALLGIGIVFYLNRTLSLPIYEIRFGGGDWSIETYLAVYCMGILAYFIKPVKQMTFNVTQIIKRYFISLIIGGGIIGYIISIVATDQKYFWFMLCILSIYTLFLQPELNKRVSTSNGQWIVNNSSIIFLVVLLFTFINTKIMFPELFLSLLTTTVIFACLEGGSIVRYIFENKFILHIGKISYSFYLFHLLIISFFTLIPLTNDYIRFFSILLITIGVSSLSERYIEQPFIARGRNANKVYPKKTS